MNPGTGLREIIGVGLQESFHLSFPENQQDSWCLQNSRGTFHILSRDLFLLEHHLKTPGKMAGF